MKHLNCKLYYQQLHFKQWCNLARYWLQTVWGWHYIIKICRSLIICEIVLYLLVRVQNKKKMSGVLLGLLDSFVTSATFTQWHGVITPGDLYSRESGCSHFTLVSRASVIMLRLVRHPVGTGSCHYVHIFFWLLYCTTSPLQTISTLNLISYADITWLVE